MHIKRQQATEVHKCIALFEQCQRAHAHLFADRRPVAWGADGTVPSRSVSHGVPWQYSALRVDSDLLLSRKGGRARWSSPVREELTSPLTPSLQKCTGIGYSE